MTYVTSSLNVPSITENNHSISAETIHHELLVAYLATGI